jgi:drug/metabolite transporter (DMT)-like permease
MGLWFYALPLVTMAELTAISFSGPLFICLGATLFLKERMTGARWTAVLVGFAGVMLVVRPWQGAAFGAQFGAQFGGMPTGILLMLLATPLFAGSFLAAKALTAYDKPEVIVFWQHVLVALLGFPVALALWSMPDAAQWALLVVCGLIGVGGHYCTARAFRVADISAVQSLKFLELIWAALLGLAVFGTIPGLWTVLGGVVIFLSTLLLARQETRSPRP